MKSFHTKHTFEKAQMRSLKGAVKLTDLLHEPCSPDLASIHTGGESVTFSQPKESMLPVIQMMLSRKLPKSVTTSCTCRIRAAKLKPNGPATSLQGVTRKRPSVKKCDCSLAHKKLSVHEGRNKAYCLPGPEKQTHCLSLRKEIGKHKSFGKRPRVDGCSEEGCVAHPVYHEHYTSHKWGRYCESRSQFQFVECGHKV